MNHYAQSLPESFPVGRPAELMVFAGLLGLANLSLLWGRPATALVYLPWPVAAGEWWRLFFHPFVHVSGYHLLLDGAAFLLLYGSLEVRRVWGRVALVVACAAGSLALAWAASPEIHALGLCGLSGVDHGLMAACGWEMALSGDRTRRALGFGGILLVAGKALLEVHTGQAVLAPLHLAAIGHPIAVCHLGGVLGGTAGILVLRSLRAARNAPGSATLRDRALAGARGEREGAEL